MYEREEPDLDRVRNAMRDHDERVEQDEQHEPEPEEAEPEEDDG